MATKGQVLTRGWKSGVAARGDKGMHLRGFVCAERVTGVLRGRGEIVTGVAHSIIAEVPKGRAGKCFLARVKMGVMAV